MTKPTRAASDKRIKAIACACAAIDRDAGAVNFAALAHDAGMSRFHFHRRFAATTGLTPGAYAKAARAERARAALANGARVTDTIYASGYHASSRFYSDAAAALGMTPTRYRDRGRGAVIRFAIGDCSLGVILVAATAVGVCAILLGDDPDGLARDLQDRFGDAELIGANADFEATVARVVALVDGHAPAHDLPLDIRGTAFQRRVWEALRRIGCGHTASYAEIAAAIGAPRSVRAVAGAIAANPLAVAIPCHRVIRTDGALSGYRWGVERKTALLARERIQSRSTE